MELVDDPDDPRLSDFIGLTDAQLRRSAFIVEGELAIRQLLRSAYPVRAVLLTEALFTRLAPALGDHPVYVASRAVMRAVTGFDIHRGAVASAARLPDPDPASLLAAARQVAVLEGLNDHENLGVLFRNAAAFGIDAVLLDPTCADPLYRRTVRVSLGHVLHVPFARLAPWPESLELIAESGFELVAMTPRGESVLSPRAAPRIAVLLGAEGPGLSEAALAAADVRVRIPMTDGVDSINVATAAAIAFHAYHPAP